MDASLKRYWLAAGLGTLWAMFILIAQWAGAFEQIEQPFLDWRQSLPSPQASHESEKALALVAIDYIPVDRPWPWPRLDYVILLRSILPYAPRSIVFEPLLHDTDTRYSAFDSTLGMLVNRLDHVVFAAAARTPEDKSPPPQNLTSLHVTGSLKNMPRFGSTLWPLDTFASGAAVGIFNLMPETSGAVHRLPLLFFYNGRIVPSLSLQAVAQYLNADWSKSDATMGQAIRLRSTNGTLLRTIPIDNQGRIEMRYRNAPPAFWTASFGDVPVYAQERERGETPGMDLSALRGRQVWIGRTDRKESPAAGLILPKISTVELQMIAASNILNNDFIQRVPTWALVVFYLLFSAMGAAFYLRYGWVHGGVFAFLILSVWWEASFTLFRAANADLPLVSFTLLTIGVAGIAYAAHEWELVSEDGDQLLLPIE